MNAYTWFKGHNITELKCTRAMRHGAHGGRDGASLKVHTGA